MELLELIWAARQQAITILKLTFVWRPMSPHFHRSPASRVPFATRSPEFQAVRFA